MSATGTQGVSGEVLDDAPEASDSEEEHRDVKWALDHRAGFGSPSTSNSGRENSLQDNPLEPQ